MREHGTHSNKCESLLFISISLSLSCGFLPNLFALHSPRLWLRLLSCSFFSMRNFLISLNPLPARFIARTTRIHQLQLLRVVVVVVAAAGIHLLPHNKYRDSNAAETSVTCSVASPIFSRPPTNGPLPSPCWNSIRISTHLSIEIEEKTRK